MKGVGVDGVGKSAPELNLIVPKAFGRRDSGKTSLQENRLSICHRNPYRKLSDLSGDDEVFFWLTPEEWIGLGAGSQYGDVEVLSCACEECESERYAEYWVGEYE